MSYRLVSSFQLNCIKMREKERGEKKPSKVHANCCNEQCKLKILTDWKSMWFSHLGTDRYFEPHGKYSECEWLIGYRFCYQILLEPDFSRFLSPETVQVFGTYDYNDLVTKPFDSFNSLNENWSWLFRIRAMKVKSIDLMLRWKMSAAPRKISSLNAIICRSVRNPIWNYVSMLFLVSELNLHFQMLLLFDTKNYLMEKDEKKTQMLSVHLITSFAKELKADLIAESAFFVQHIQTRYAQDEWNTTFSLYDNNVLCAVFVVCLRTCRKRHGHKSANC